MLESLSTEKNSLVFQLERLEQQVNSAAGSTGHGSSINMSGVDNGEGNGGISENVSLSSFPSLLSHTWLWIVRERLFIWKEASSSRAPLFSWMRPRPCAVWRDCSWTGQWTDRHPSLVWGLEKGGLRADNPNETCGTPNKVLLTRQIIQQGGHFRKLTERFAAMTFQSVITGIKANT